MGAVHFFTFRNMKIIKMLILLKFAFLSFNYSGFCQIKDAEPKQSSNKYDSPENRNRRIQY